MKANEYLVLTDAVDAGVEMGWRRAHKHTDEPDDEAIKSAIYDEVLNAITAMFIFEEQNRASTD